MKLRRQLLLVSLLSLSLPWAGCQYVREMEEALRQGQNTALQATAWAVAKHILNEPALLNELQQPSAQVYATNQIYAHTFPSPVILDGYDDEWRERKFAGKEWQRDNFRVQLQAASFARDLYLFIRVDDANLLYYNPGFKSLARGDHLIIRTQDQQGDAKDYLINTSSPGLVNAYFAQQTFDEYNQPVARFLREHRIKGVWQERRGGYQLELQLPLNLTGGYLGLAVINKQSYDAEQPGEWLGSIAESTAAKNHPLSPVVKENAALSAALAVFASDDLRLRITGRNQWLIAEAGQLQAHNKLPVAKGGLLTWLMRRVLTRHRLPSVDTPQFSGRMEAGEILRALDGETVSSWYNHGVHNLGRAVVPVITHNRIIGTVVVEQTSASMLMLTNTAFQRLFIYTLLATLLAGIGLVAYASWLSLRIRTLSQAADTAIAEEGKLINQFPVSNAKDEIGDLNRSYGKLLTRLQEYTDYLRSLSNKLSHELRTPLAVVRSSLDNLENENLDARSRVFATRAQEGSQRLSNILNAISSASRVEETIRTSDMERFALDKVVRELSHAYQDIAQQQIICAIDEEQDYRIYGSADLIVQMIDKLFDNACDFCPRSGKIILSLAKNKGEILFTISNDGPLLPQKMQSQLFDSLVSIRDSNNERYASDNKIHLGLGLHIVQLIVEVHQARVAARNRRDLTGVEFEVTFTI